MNLWGTFNTAPQTCGERTTKNILKKTVNLKGVECKNQQWAKKEGKETESSRVLVAHSCDPSYSGGRNQEDPGSKLALDK
jgi:hypothetical protein